MNKIKFAIVGCGRIAEKHALYADQFGSLIAVCDVMPEKADLLAAQYQAKAFYAIETLLQTRLELDVVVICTPNGLHAVQSIQALEAGYHVLVEKPMALTVSDCNAMMEAAVRAGKQLFTVKQNRFNPPVQALKKAIDENKIGQLYTFQLTCFWNRPETYYEDSWHGTALDGGVLFTQFSHFIDLIYWLFGEVITVEANCKNFAHQQSIHGEDTGVVLFEMENGALGTLNYSVNSLEKNAEGSLTIIAEKLTFKIGGEYLNKIDYQQGEAIQLFEADGKQLSNDYGSYKGSMSNHHLVYRSLVDTLEKQLVYYATAYEAMKTVEIIRRIYSAAKNGSYGISRKTS